MASMVAGWSVRVEGDTVVRLQKKTPLYVGIFLSVLFLVASSFLAQSAVKVNIRCWYYPTGLDHDQSRAASVSCEARWYNIMNLGHVWSVLGKSGPAGLGHSASWEVTRVGQMGIKADRLVTTKYWHDITLEPYHVYPDRPQVLPVALMRWTGLVPPYRLAFQESKEAWHANTMDGAPTWPARVLSLFTQDAIQVVHDQRGDGNVRLISFGEGYSKFYFQQYQDFVQRIEDVLVLLQAKEKDDGGRSQDTEGRWQSEEEDPVYISPPLLPMAVQPLIWAISFVFIGLSAVTAFEASEWIIHIEDGCLVLGKKNILGQGSESRHSFKYDGMVSPFKSEVKEVRRRNDSSKTSFKVVVEFFGCMEESDQIQNENSEQKNLCRVTISSCQKKSSALALSAFLNDFACNYHKTHQRQSNKKKQ